MTKSITTLEDGILQITDRRIRTVVIETDQTIQSTTVFEDVTELVITLIRGKRYKIDLTILYNSGTIPDIKFKFKNIDTGLDEHYYFDRWDDSELLSKGFDDNFTPNGATSNRNAKIEGYCKVGVSADYVFQLQYAQSTSTASDTTVKAGTNITIMEID